MKTPSAKSNNGDFNTHCIKVLESLVHQQYQFLVDKKNKPENYSILAASNAINAPDGITTQISASTDYLERTLPDELPTCSAGGNEIEGTVFEDFNYNGVYDAGEDVGLENITVTATDSLNNTVSTSTDANGNYTFSGLTSGRTYRIEFTNIPAGTSFTFYGVDNGTSVQFVQSGNCANLGIANPNNYCPEEEAEFVAVCFSTRETGDPAVVSWAITGGANNNTAADYTMPSEHSINVDVSEVKSVWGLAYDRNRQVLYQSANLKDRATPAVSLGNIFVTDNSNNDGTDANITTANVWVDLNSPAYFNGALGDYTGNDDPAVDGVDDESFAKTHKVGIGDIDLNLAGDTLFATDLANRRLLGIPVANDGTPPLFSAITKNNIPVPTSCDASLGDTLRVFGLEVYNNKVYVGCICDAAGTKDITRLDAFVYEYSSGTGFNTTPVLSVDLDYSREASSGSPRAGDANNDGAWTYWTDDVTEPNWRIRTYATNEGFGVRPSPSLTDIEFINGNMVIGFSDRTADQVRRIDAGHAKNPFVFQNNNSNPFMFVLAVGDVLMAGNNGDGTWSIENNGVINSTTSGTLTTNGSFNGAGPGGREFFYQDDYTRGNHYETMTGTLQQYPNKNILISMGWDPYRGVNGQFGSGGAFYFDTEDGDWLKSYALFGGPAGGNFNFGKGNSFGDVELICPPAPLEIGNYVWMDVDGNGIQDAGEPPLEGVIIAICDTLCNEIAYDTTDANGQYFFNDENVSGGLKPQEDYLVVFGVLGQFNTTDETIFDSLRLTTANIGVAGNSDATDSDGIINNSGSGIGACTIGHPFIQVKMGNFGEVNHTYDIGFKPPRNPTASIFAIQPSCDNDTVQTDGYLQISAFSNGDRYNFSVGSTYTEDAGDGAGDADYANASTIGALPFKFNLGQSNPTGSRDYTIRVFNGNSSCFTDFVVTMEEQDCAIGCDCKEYIYLNDTQEDAVHKFAVDSMTGTLTEISAPWHSGINNPHGLGTDGNGFLYIADVSNDFSQAIIKKLDCDGNIVDDNYYTFSRFITNASTDNDNRLYLYGKKSLGEETSIEVLDLCTGNRIACNQTDSNGWGFYVKGDRFWVTNADCSDPVRYGNVADITNNCGSNVPLQSFPVSSTCQTGYTPRGIFEDDLGFVYVLYNTASNPFSGGGNVYIVKYNPDGSVKAQSAIDSDVTDGGYYRSRGIVADENGYIFVGSRDGDDAAGLESCITVLEDDGAGNLIYVSQYNNEAGTPGSSKGVAINKECCPKNNNVTVDTALCAASVNDVYFLQDLISCEGTICEGIWVADAGNTGLTYNACENSITITAINACGTFTLESDGAGSNLQCGAFVMTLNISVDTITAPVISGNQTVCEGDDPATFTITTPASGSSPILYQWQSSSDSLTGYSDIEGATDAAYNPPNGIMDTTFYRVITSSNSGCSSATCMDTSNVVTVNVQPCDWGDLPDPSAGTNPNNYQTTRVNNGPVHAIIAGLSLGNTVDSENDGNPSNDALGDGIDEDGLSILDSLDIQPASDFRLPLSYINTTSDTAYIEAWIDWNGDGDFEDADEMIFDAKDPNQGFFNRINVSVPANAVNNQQVGLRIRISNTDNMTTTGYIATGEVEDYLIGINCPSIICLPVISTINRE